MYVLAWDIKVGVSNRNWDSSNPSDPTRESANLMPMTVRGRFPPLEPVNGKSVGRFSPQNSKKPNRTEIWSIIRQRFLELERSQPFPARSQIDPWNHHQIWRDLFIYAQIQLQFSGFCSNKAQIWWKYDGFCSNPTKLWGFCSNLMTIWFFFAQISWVLHKSGEDLILFCSDVVSFAQIRQRSGEKYRLLPKGTSDSIFVGFDRSNRQSNIFDPTWPVGFCGRRWVFSPKTQHHWVGCGLSTNLTQGHPYIKGMQSIKASSLTVIFIFDGVL